VYFVISREENNPGISTWEMNMSEQLILDIKEQIQFLSYKIAAMKETIDSLQGASQISPEDLSLGDVWTSTKSGSLEQDSAIFQVGDNVITTNSTQVNVHCHNNKIFDIDTGLYIHGKMQIDDLDGGIGVCFLSQMPETYAYYRLRRYANDTTFKLSPPSSDIVVEGSIDSAFIPTLTSVNYLLHLTLEDVGVRIKAKLWNDGDSVPGSWSIDCYDSQKQFTSGTIGLWSMGPGRKLWITPKVSRKLPELS